VATKTWTGVTGTWTTAGNWSPSGAPGTGDDVVFPSGTYSVTVNGNVNCANFTVTATSGTVTFLSSGANTISVSGGSFTLTSNVVWGIPTNSLGINFLTAGGTINTAGVTLNSNLTFTGVGLTWVLGSDVTIGATRTVTLTSGTLNLANFKLTCGLFNSSNSNARTIAFGASGNITVNGNGGTLWTTSTATSFTSSGSRNVTVDNNTSSATTVASGVPSANPDTNSLNFAFISGSYTLSLTFGAKNNLNFTGFTGTVNNVAQTIYGDVVLANAVTFTGGASAWTLTASTTPSTRNIDLANKTALGFPLIFTGGLSTFKFARDTTLNTYTWTSGIFDLNGFVVKATTLVSTGGSAVANGGRFEVTGNATTVVNLSSTGASSDVPIRLTYAGGAGTRTISNFGTGGFSLEFSGAATDTVSFSGVATLRNLDTANFGGTMNFGGNINTYGSLNFNSNTVTGTSTRTLTLYGSATQFTLGAATSFPPFTGINVQPAANYKLNADVTVSQQIALIGNAALDLNGKTLTAQYGYGVLVSGNTPTITMSSGTISLSGDTLSLSGPVWDTTDNTTFVGNGTISCTSALAKRIGPVGRALPTVNQAGIGLLALEDDGTASGYALADLTSTVNIPLTSTTITLQNARTTTFTNFTLSGNANSQIIFKSGGAGVQATISKASGTVSVSYLTIQDIAATGGATWNAFTSAPYNNVDNGNNTGWNFTAPAGSYTITALNGSYSVSGQTATVSRSRALDASNGSYSVTGQTATVSRGRSLIAFNGNYVVSGQSATLSRGCVLTASNGSYSVSGQTATVSRSRSLNASSGSYSVTGQSIAVSFGRLLSAQNGVYSVAGQVVDISVGVPPTPVTAIEYFVEIRSFTERRRF